MAQEVRKLADNTKLSAGSIESDVQGVQESVRRLTESVSDLATISEAQAIGVVELTKAIAYIAKMAQELVDLGKMQDI
ncbi:Methyl-accepting chemotaxis protein (fragment) [Candidatus Desulfosporosinus infrequens]|uniref:Methyl-accepting chemotaxis protein n=1 Tax=Candidatus Desulfosporosinus infrequens TaxID=2043169 RepID=A0A2U3KNP5_9FIRM